jgi:hypothetical protein
VSDSAGDSTESSLAIGSDGFAWLAWTDASQPDTEIYVRRFDGNFWAEAGTSGASVGGVSNNNNASYAPSLAVGPSLTPHLAWVDGNTGAADIYARYFNGSGWVDAGTGSAAGGGVSNDSADSVDPSIGVAPDGSAYLAWTSIGNSSAEVFVKRLGGGAWQDVGGGSAQGGGISRTSTFSGNSSVSITPTGIPYVAWGENLGSNSDIYVRRYAR